MLKSDSASVFLVVTDCDADSGISFIQSQIIITNYLNAHWVVVTRNENTKLLHWLSGFRKSKPDMFIETFLVTCTRDVNEAMLKTKSIWSERNTVLYPNQNGTIATIEFAKHEGEALFRFPPNSFSQEGV